MTEKGGIKIKVYRIIKDEKGVALAWLAVSLIGVMLMMAFMLEGSRMLYFRHELQAIADAASLAGASQTRADPIVEYDEDFGETVFIDYRIVIDPYFAAQEALSAYHLNKLELLPDWGETKGFERFQSYVIDEDQYYAEIEGWIDLFFMDRIVGLENSKIPIRVRATSKIIER